MFFFWTPDFRMFGQNWLKSADFTKNELFSTWIFTIFSRPRFSPDFEVDFTPIFIIFFDDLLRRFVVDFSLVFSSIFGHFLRKSREVRKWLSIVNLQYIVRVGVFEIWTETDGKTNQKLDGKIQENWSKNGLKNWCAKTHENWGLQGPNLVPKIVPGSSPEGARRVSGAFRGPPDANPKKHKIFKRPRRRFWADFGSPGVP